MNLNRYDISDGLRRIRAGDDPDCVGIATLKSSLQILALCRATPSSDEDLRLAAEEIVMETRLGGRNSPRNLGSELPICFLLLRCSGRDSTLVSTLVKRWIFHLDECAGSGGVHAAVMMVSCWVCAHVLETHGFHDDSIFLEGAAGSEEVQRGESFSLACLVRASRIVRLASLPSKKEARYLAN